MNENIMILQSQNKAQVIIPDIIYIGLRPTSFAQIYSAGLLYIDKDTYLLKPFEFFVTSQV